MSLQFVERLLYCVRGDFSRDSIYDRGSDRYNIRINLELFRQEFAEVSSSDLFRQFDKRAQGGKHEFDKLCTALDIEHRVTPPRSPQTNGMVERFNGRIEDVLQSHHFQSGEELEATLHRYVWLYNQQLPQSALGKRTRLEAELVDQPAPPPALHPKLAGLYREKVCNLAAALKTPEARADAAQSLRGLIDKIVLTPASDGYCIDLHGYLAGILTLASARNDKTAVAFGPSAVSQVSLVAGEGFRLWRTYFVVSRQSVS